MTTLLALLDQYIFSGVPSNAAWDLIKWAWEKVNEKSWEDLYFAAFEQAVVDMRPSLTKYAHGDIGIDKDDLHHALHQDLPAPVDAMSVSELTDRQFTDKLAASLSERKVLTIGGHRLSEADYTQLTRNLIKHASFLFRESVQNNEVAFRKALLTETLDNQSLLREIWAHLLTHNGLVLDRLATIEEKVDSIEQGIVQRLGLDRPEDSIIEDIQSAFDAAPRGPMFKTGGLCSGFLLRPMPDRYFVAQEFGPEREDLRQALTAALAGLDRKPVVADDFLWSGHILCKISALIQGTPFGVYQLTASQNRNVYLELGIAIGLGRPFVLIKDRDAEVAPLAQGLDYYPIDSYLELRYDFLRKVRPFLANIVNYRPHSVPDPDSEETVLIVHGDADVLDFCVPLAKMVANRGLKPVMLGDPTGKLAYYLDLENIENVIVGGTGQTRMDETVSAIRTARLGLYRIDEESSADAFLTLGVSMGLNQPGLLLQRSNRQPPSDVRGLGSIEFGPYSGLNEVLAQPLDRLLSRY